MAFYKVNTVAGEIAINLDLVESFVDLPCFEGNEEEVLVHMVSGNSHKIKKLSLFTALMHSGVPVMGTGEVKAEE